MANINVSDEQFNALLALRDDLDQQSRTAQASGNAYMTAVFIDLLAVVAQRVSKVQAARHRQMLADHRRQVKALRTNGHTTAPVS